MTTGRTVWHARALVVDRVAVLRHASLFASTPGRVLAGLATRLEEVVCESAVLDPHPRVATVVARTDGFAFKLHRQDFDEAMRLRPEIASSVVTALARRLREICEAVE